MKPRREAGLGWAGGQSHNVNRLGHFKNRHVGRELRAWYLNGTLVGATCSRVPLNCEEAHDGGAHSNV